MKCLFQCFVAFAVVAILCATADCQKLGKQCGDGVCEGPETAMNCPADCSLPNDEKHASAAPEVLTITIGSADPEHPNLPLLGVNSGPVPSGEPGNADVTEGYKKIGVNAVRIHDYYGPLDMATMYPSQDADPDDPASYNFTESDKVFAAIVGAGFEPYFRLGDSWNNAKGFPAANLRHPTNADNWARAAAYVVSHYSDPSLWGRNPLRYIEIWNEPDNKQFWDGTNEEFYDLYVKTAVALKNEFPELKIGGSGFIPAAVKTEKGKKYVEEFMKYISAKKAPMDFISWHLYSNDPADFAEASVFYRRLLDKYRYTKAEVHNSEWNDSTDTPGETLNKGALRLGGQGAAIITAAWIAMQQNGVTASMLYRGTDTSPDLPTFYGLFRADGRPKSLAEAFSLWAAFAKYPERMKVSVSPRNDNFWILAGRNAAGEIAFLIANPTGSELRWTLGENLKGVFGHKLEVNEGKTTLPAGDVNTIGAYSVNLLIR